MSAFRPHWCRFHVPTGEMPHFEYEGPWWVSAETATSAGEQTVVVAAVMAESEDGARRAIEGCFDEGHTLARWDYGDEIGADWRPAEKGSGSRFERADWMKWPWPEVA